MQLLVFSLCGEEYAVKLIDIREIIHTPALTLVPNVPHGVKGIANLRGKVVTVIDLGTLLHLASKEGQEKQHVIVTERNGELFGILVDTVVGVLRTSTQFLRNAPELLSAKLESTYVLGVLVIANAGKQPTHAAAETSPGTDTALQAERMILFLNLQQVVDSLLSAPPLSHTVP